MININEITMFLVDICDMSQKDSTLSLVRRLFLVLFCGAVTPCLTVRQTSIRRCDGLTKIPGKSSEEGQEDHETLNQLGGVPPSFFTLPWFPWLAFWLLPGLHVSLSHRFMF